METIPTIHDITLPQPSNYSTMLVLPNMDPSLHTSRSLSLPWAFLRRLTSCTARLSIIILKIIGTAIATFLLPRTIHVSIQCLDTLYETLGRRARSPWDTQYPWGYGALAGFAIMLVLHDVLCRISCHAILEQDAEREQVKGQHHGNGTWRPWKMTWERTLMQVLIPALLYGGLCVIAWQVWKIQKENGKEYIKANTVNLADDENARLVWRDR